MTDLIKTESRGPSAVHFFYFYCGAIVLENQQMEVISQFLINHNDLDMEVANINNLHDYVF